MEAKLGDTLRLYEVDGYYEDVEIVERWEGKTYYDTIGSDGEYGNTMPTHKSIEDLIEAYNLAWHKIEVISEPNIRDNWLDLLNGETVWVTKYELDEILDNLKSLNINTLMIQSCKDKFVVKVDKLTIDAHKEA